MVLENYLDVGQTPFNYKYTWFLRYVTEKKYAHTIVKLMSDGIENESFIMSSYIYTYLCMYIHTYVTKLAHKKKNFCNSNLLGLRKSIKNYTSSHWKMMNSEPESIKVSSWY